MVVRKPASFVLLVFCVFFALGNPFVARAEDGTLSGSVVDIDSGALLPARVYVTGEDGRGWHVASASTEGSAVPYAKERGASSTLHTTLSTHAFTASLPPGRYTLTAERGKEWFPVSRSVHVAAGQVTEVALPLRRWIDMPARAWYSGDTHTHRAVGELPNVMLAEDLNVAFPLTSWVTHAFEPPSRPKDEDGGASDAELVRVDDTHVFWPRNTEYEIFTTGGRSHTLGAVFLLGHRRIFERGVPPVAPVAEETHRAGGLIELDKHNWPWSMAIIPVMDVDLYELSNNHIWRAPFAFRAWGEPPADYMSCERTEDGLSEWGWIDFTFQNYYALLDCGFRLRPTAGTASGVHPVPLGFGRVYVHCPGGFSYESWCRGLDAGRSFVTTGPMLFATVNGKLPGEGFSAPGSYRVDVEVIAESDVESIDIVVNGEIAERIEPENRRTRLGARRSEVTRELAIDASSWIAVRAIDRRAGGRVRFAHSAPFFIDIDQKPVRPRLVEVDYLSGRVRSELERSAALLPDEALAEYRSALERYEALREIAR